MLLNQLFLIFSFFFFSFLALGSWAADISAVTGVAEGTIRISYREMYPIKEYLIPPNFATKRLGWPCTRVWLRLLSEFLPFRFPLLVASSPPTLPYLLVPFSLGTLPFLGAPQLHGIDGIAKVRAYYERVGETLPAVVKQEPAGIKLEHMDQLPEPALATPALPVTNIKTETT